MSDRNSIGDIDPMEAWSGAGGRSILSTGSMDSIGDMPPGSQMNDAMAGHRGLLMPGSHTRRALVLVVVVAIAVVKERFATRNTVDGIGQSIPTTGSMDSWRAAIVDVVVLTLTRHAVDRIPGSQRRLDGGDSLSTSSTATWS